jgi:hypothetical protein
MNLQQKNSELESHVEELEKDAAATATDSFLKDHYHTIRVGKLSDEVMKRFNLGSYSKTSTPDSSSL